MPAQQPLHVQHARPVLLLVPGRPGPPVHAPLGVQPELRQPQQAHRHPLRLARPLDRVPGPRPALLPPQPLLQVPEPVLLAEPGGEQFDHLQPGQLRRRSDQREPLLVPLDPGDDRLDRHVMPRDPPQADDLLPADLPPPAVEECVSLRASAWSSGRPGGAAAASCPTSASAPAAPPAVPSAAGRGAGRRAAAGSGTRSGGSRPRASTRGRTTVLEGVARRRRRPGVAR